MKYHTLSQDEIIRATDEFKFESMPDEPCNWATCEIFAGRPVSLFVKHAKQRVVFRRKIS